METRLPISDAYADVPPELAMMPLYEGLEINSLTYFFSNATLVTDIKQCSLIELHYLPHQPLCGCSQTLGTHKGPGLRSTPKTVIRGTYCAIKCPKGYVVRSTKYMLNEGALAVMMERSKRNKSERAGVVDSL